METKKSGDIQKRLDTVITIFFWVQVVMGGLWAFQDPMPPLQDYPNHVANVFIMLKLSASAFFQNYYFLEYFPYPYLLQDIILSVFMYFGGVDFAAKAFAALALMAIPSGMYYLLRKVMPDKLYLAYFALPLIWNKPFFKGNCNFILGTALAFLTLALLWELLQKEMTRKAIVKVTAGALLVFLTHLIAFYLFMYCVAIMVAYSVWQTRDKKRALLLLPFLPAIVLMMLNMVSTRGMYAGQNLLGVVFSKANFTGKVSEIPLLLLNFSNQELRLLLPYFIGLSLLMLAGLPRLRANPLPWLLCLALFVLYLFTPRNMLVMVRPHERVICFLLFLVPLCCLNRRFLVVEKFAVVGLCSMVFFQVSDYYTRVASELTPSMSQARTLLDELPPRKKLMGIWAQWPGMGQIGYAYCVMAYYTMDREGYVASLYTQKYTVIKQKNALPYSPHPKDLTLELVKPFDFLYVWGREPQVESFLKQAGFVPRKELSNMSVYEKLPPL